MERTTSSDVDATSHSPRLILAVGGDESAVRAIDSVLTEQGYVVLLARTGSEGLRLASRTRPDLVLVCGNPSDMTGLDLCARLGALRSVRPSTPIVVLSQEPFRKANEVDALEAGAWAFMAPPHDVRELLVRVRRFVEAKRDVDLALESSFLDPGTGVYNVQGLVRRVEEYAADAQRANRPFACVVFGPCADGDPADRETDAFWNASNLIRSATRTSDAVGRIGLRDFVVLAPGTNANGAHRLAERVMSAFSHPRPGLVTDGHEPTVRAGYCAASGEDVDRFRPEEILRRASIALRLAQETPLPVRIREFQSG